MRLWHIDLIPYLPKSQLVAQNRELGSIYKDQPNHILINYIYNYDKEYLLCYSISVHNEMVKRGFKIKDWTNYNNYFKNVFNRDEILRFTEHSFDYLTQCFYNLQEKYQRGQKDFSKEIYNKLENFYLKEKRKSLKKGDVL